MKIPYSKEQLEQLCAESDSYNEILAKTGRTKSTSNRDILKKYIEKYEIDISHFSHSTGRKENNTTDTTDIKICEQCKTPKNKFNDYYWSNGHTRNICKECVKENERKKYKEKQDKFFEYKKNSQCKKCGETRFYLLDFHHRVPEEKSFTISDKIRLDISNFQVQLELEKCDCLCANCHREWHFLNQHQNLNYEEWLIS